MFTSNIHISSLLLSQTYNFHHDQEKRRGLCLFMSYLSRQFIDDAMMLRVSIRDLTKKTPIRETHRPRDLGTHCQGLTSQHRNLEDKKLLDAETNLKSRAAKFML